jgi:NADPH2:quinone reductase
MNPALKITPIPWMSVGSFLSQQFNPVSSRKGAFMKAIQIYTYGDASQLSYEEVPLSEPKAGQVRVKIQATGLNFVEIYQRKGLYKVELPYCPGAEFAGTVDALGAGVTGFEIGERVATARGSCGYAEFGIAPASQLVTVPPEISIDQAAALMLQGMTAHYLARSTYPIKPGDTALVHAAAGGVGQLLTQIAKKFGARVVGTTSTREKAAIARRAGADEVILYTEEDFETAVERLTDGQGVQVVYDGVGKTTFTKGLNCLVPRGYMVLFGQASGPVETFNPQILNQKGSLFLTRPSLSHYLHNREEVLQRSGDLFRWIKDGDLTVQIDRIFPMAQADEAQRYIEARQTKGKVLLIP